MEARSASGEVVAKEHAEIITAGGWMIPTFIAAVVVALVIIVVSGAFTSAWIRIPLIVLGVLVGFISAASIGFALWGKYLGFPWHFTP